MLLYVLALDLPASYPLQPFLSRHWNFASVGVGQFCSWLPVQPYPPPRPGFPAAGNKTHYRQGTSNTKLAPAFSSFSESELLLAWYCCDCLFPFLPVLLTGHNPFPHTNLWPRHEVHHNSAIYSEMDFRFSAGMMFPPSCQHSLTCILVGKHFVCISS